MRNLVGERLDILVLNTGVSKAAPLAAYTAPELRAQEKSSQPVSEHFSVRSVQVECLFTEPRMGLTTELRCEPIQFEYEG